MMTPFAIYRQANLAKRETSGMPTFGHVSRFRSVNIVMHETHRM